jgi:predicted RNA-binding Zn-ribbon protein involved in translation (DUF1610 family)
MSDQRKNEKAFLSNPIAFVEEHYSSSRCGKCGDESIPSNVTMDLKKINAGEDMVGRVWLECPLCGELEMADLWVK